MKHLARSGGMTFKLTNGREGKVCNRCRQLSGIQRPLDSWRYVHASDTCKKVATRPTPSREDKTDTTQPFVLATGTGKNNFVGICAT